MKRSAVIGIVIGVFVWLGCERPVEEERPVIVDPAGVEVESAGDFREAIDRWAESEKTRIEAEARLIKAQIEAEEAWEEIEWILRDLPWSRPIREPAAPAIVQQQEELDRQVLREVRRSIIRDDHGRILAEIARDVKIEVQGGVVTLHGKARSEEERGQIEERTRAVHGVREVINRLEFNEGAAQAQN